METAVLRESGLHREIRLPSKDPVRSGTPVRPGITDPGRIIAGFGALTGVASGRRRPAGRDPIAGRNLLPRAVRATRVVLLTGAGRDPIAGRNLLPRAVRATRVVLLTGADRLAGGHLVMDARRLAGAAKMAGRYLVMDARRLAGAAKMAGRYLVMDAARLAGAGKTAGPDPAAGAGPVAARRASVRHRSTDPGRPTVLIRLAAAAGPATQVTAMSVPTIATSPTVEVTRSATVRGNRPLADISRRRARMNTSTAGFCRRTLIRPASMTAGATAAARITRWARPAGRSAAMARSSAVTLNAAVRGRAMATVPA